MYYDSEETNSCFGDIFKILFFMEEECSSFHYLGLNLHSIIFNKFVDILMRIHKREIYLEVNDSLIIERLHICILHPKNNDVGLSLISLKMRVCN